VKTHRDELARASRYAFEHDAAMNPPFGLVAHLSWQRDLSRAFGDDTEAARIQSIIDRHLDAFGTRRQLAAWLLTKEL
jgi:hypothetical protein